jgi:predicted GIY-YIG superfamily endonuclease
MLRCIDGTFYTGMTNDVTRRFDEHNVGSNATCYTFSRRPLRLVYVGEFPTALEAIAFEKRLKNWTHRKKRAFADRDWPALSRFAAGRT